MGVYFTRMGGVCVVLVGKMIPICMTAVTIEVSFEKRLETSRTVWAAEANTAGRSGQQLRETSHTFAVRYLSDCDLPLIVS